MSRATPKPRRTKKDPAVTSNVPARGQRLSVARGDDRFEFEDRLPLLPLRDVVIFPYMTLPLVTWATHGEPFVAAVENGPLCATQFHPEKSGDAGAALLANWLETLT